MYLINTLLIMLNKSQLRPVRIDNLVRLGRDNDGGYIIPKIILDKCDGLLSYGINKDWSFEKDISKYDTILNIHCYDHTLTISSLFKFSIKSVFVSLFRLLTLDKIRLKKSFEGIVCIPNYFSFFQKNIIHYKKRILDKNNNGNISILKTIEKIKLKGSNKIFIKMDIEGDEYLSLNEYIKSHNSILGFAIEFHDINNRSNEFNDLIKKLKQNYFIAHVHGNNYSKVDQKTGLPSSVEITLINKKLIKEPTVLSNYKYPIDGLDQPNKHSRPDIILKF